MSDADITHAKGEERAKRGYAWALDVYGERTKEPRYQAFRFLEEAMELAQTQGLTLDDFIRTAQYVAARKVGDTKIEIGDTRLCLDILAENLGLSVDGCYTSCLARIQFLDPDKCREKDDAKVACGLI
jgi:hypothetical protein